MKIDVDTSVCIGAGLCVLAADEVMDQDDDGIVVLLDDSPQPGMHDAVRRAASLCPARAITIRESA
ncbi:ferredoxin [Pseudonocardia sp. GCM10023141]|uniref:ferredoxin n=1 Tax=Pseudonocardia sp. GCM10023141 TaxID=3252653 RepID=UPI00361D2EAE